jgi:hypothetical protein
MLYHVLAIQWARRSMLVIVNLSLQDVASSSSVLSEVDSALASIGLKKQVRSVLVPGKQFSTTYDGPSKEKTVIDQLVGPIAQRHGAQHSVELEESVSFP